MTLVPFIKSLTEDELEDLDNLLEEIFMTDYDIVLHKKVSVNF